MHTRTELNNFLQKVAKFTKIALEHVENLEDKASSLSKDAAVKELQQSRYKAELKKVAKALYQGDFLIDQYEQEEFIKKAASDPSYLAKVMVKICSAAEVSSIGSPARVTTKQADADFDPVAAKAFGYTRYSSILEDDK